MYEILVYGKFRSMVFIRKKYIFLKITERKEEVHMQTQGRAAPIPHTQGQGHEVECTQPFPGSWARQVQPLKTAELAREWWPWMSSMVPMDLFLRGLLHLGWRPSVRH